VTPPAAAAGIEILQPGTLVAGTITKPETTRWLERIGLRMVIDTDTTVWTKALKQQSFPLRM
jgi:hypothetical protein